jgi:excisionase family DNA binding protein
MSKQKRVTLKEMAEILNRCPKTFRKYVEKYNIPHIRLGRDMLFDVQEVENHLKNRTLSEIKTDTPTSPKTKLKSQIKLSSKYDGNRFASLLKLN